MTPPEPVLDREHTHAHVRRRLVRTRTQWGDLTLLVSPTWPGWLYEAGEDDPAHGEDRDND